MSENVWHTSFPEYLDLDFLENEMALVSYDSTLTDHLQTTTLHSSTPAEATPDRQHFDGFHDNQAVNPKVAIPRNVQINTITSSGRVNQACDNCREQKAKCSGNRPTCQRCEDAGVCCVYGDRKRVRMLK